VREASKELTVAVNACLTDSNGLVERHLSTLRPKQLEEYKDAFRGTSTGTTGTTATGAAAHEHHGSTAQASTHASSTRRRDSASNTTSSAAATSSLSKMTGDTPRGNKGGTPKGGGAKGGSDAPSKGNKGGNDAPKTSPLLSPRTTGKPAGKTPRGGTLCSCC
jgi:hypothetical protein